MKALWILSAAVLALAAAAGSAQNAPPPGVGAGMAPAQKLPGIGPRPGAGQPWTAAEPGRPPRLDTRGDRHPHLEVDQAGNYVFRNEHLVAVLAKNGNGYGPLSLYPATRPTEYPSEAVAVAPVLARFTGKEGDSAQEALFTPSEVRRHGDGGLTLSGSVREGGTQWQVELSISIDREPWLSWGAKLRPAAAAGLMRFTPLPLMAGQEGLSESLFPGVAWIGPDEELRTRVPNPLTPDSYDVTIPLMAYSQAGTTVALMWDNQEVWGGPGFPAALFAPTTVPENRDLRMELSLPSTRAAAGGLYSVAAGQELKLSGKVAVIRDENSPLRAVREWTRAYGLPITRGFARSYEAERELVRKALTGAAWHPETPGWDIALGGSGSTPQPLALPALELLMDAALTHENGASGPLRAQAARVIEALRGRGGLDPRLAYRVGGADEALAAERTRLEALIRSQLANGAWPGIDPSPGIAVPSDSRTHNYAMLRGPTTLVTGRALRLLRHSILSGDTETAADGMRALDFVEVYTRVPRGRNDAPPRPVGATIGASAAPGPAAVPSLGAAAEAAEAFLLGYEVTGETRYLDDARYWADSGLPFVDFWGEDTHPALKHATVPHFGTAADGQPWAGVVSQQTGLYYARVLRAFARIRPEGFYDYVSEGIVASAEHQQHETGAHAGLLPSYWLPRENRGTGPDLLPDRLMAALYPIQGRDTEVSRVRVRVGPDRMFVASGATITRPDTTAMRLRLNLRGLPDQDAYTTISDVPARPISVEYNTHPARNYGVPIPRSFLNEAKAEAEPGWYYDPDRALLVIRLRHTGGDDHLHIRWPDSKDRSPVKRVDQKVRSKR